jgi:septal ring factor EnvC (AmiA/AmiB activator)
MLRRPVVILVVLAAICAAATLAAVGMTARLAGLVREARLAKPPSSPELPPRSDQGDELADARRKEEQARADLLRATAESSALRERVEHLQAAVDRARADEAQAMAYRDEIASLVETTAQRGDRSLADLQRELHSLGAALASRSELTEQNLARTTADAVDKTRATAAAGARLEAEARAHASRADRLEHELRVAHQTLGATATERDHANATLRKAETEIAAAKLSGEAFATEARRLRDEVKALSAKLADQENAPRLATVAAPPTPAVSEPQGPAATTSRGSVRRDPPVLVRTSSWYCRNCGKMGAGPRKGACCATDRPGASR